MTPSEAINSLIAAGWKEHQIAAAISGRKPVHQSVINRIKTGKIEPRWGMASALIELASRDDLAPPQAEAA